MYRKRATFLGGGIVAAVLVGSSMLAWANGAFGNPAVDRVGSFRTIEAQLAAKPPATSTTTSRPLSMVEPKTSRPEERVEPTRPTRPVRPMQSTQPTTATSDVSNVTATHESTTETNPAENTTIAAEPTAPTTLARVSSSSRARPPSDDDHEPSDGRGRDD